MNTNEKTRLKKAGWMALYGLAWALRWTVHGLGAALAWAHGKLEIASAGCKAKLAGEGAENGND
jgi:hypothetical protein